MNVKQLLFFLGMMFLPTVSLGGSKCCFAQLTAHNVQEILDAINIIRPNIISIRIEINNVASCCAEIISILDNLVVNVNISGLDILETQIEECCNYLSEQDSIIISILDNLQVNVNISGLDILETQIEECCNYLSEQDSIIISILDNLVVDVEVSGLDQILSCCEIVDSKIGDLDGPGTCLDSQIDVPEDINNLNLTVIQLLKTILLELRGCPCQ